MSQPSTNAPLLIPAGAKLNKPSKRSKQIEWWHDPETGKTIVSIPHCGDPCKLLELGAAICDACFVDCDGELVTKPEYKIEIKDGKLRIPCTTTSFDICLGLIDDGHGNLVECPEKLIITPCGKDPLPPIWLNPVRSINGAKPNKHGDIKLNDCCHSQITCPLTLDPDHLPTEPPDGLWCVGKSDGDTVHVCYENGSCYYTCIKGDWVLDFCKIDPDDCCHYHVTSPEPIDPTNPPTEPPPGTGGDNKTVRDTATVCHPNGMCYYTCVAPGVWELDYCKLGLTKDEVVAAFQNAPCPTTGLRILTKDCEAINAKDILPCAAVQQCRGPAESVTCRAEQPGSTIPGGTAPVPGATELFRTSIGHGQFFFGNGNTNITAIPTSINPQLAPAALTAADLPWTIPVPAHTPGCLVAIQVNYGGHYLLSPGGFFNSPAILDDPQLSGSYADSKLVSDCAFSVTPGTNIDHAGSAVYLMDFGGQAGNFTLDFGVKNIGGVGVANIIDGTNSGGAVVTVTEVCDQNGGPITIADFDCANAVQEDDLQNGGDAATATGAAFDLGDCGGLVWTAGRHVNNQQDSTLDYATNVNDDFDWSGVTDASQVYSHVSLNGQIPTFAPCQFGSYMGVVPPGAGPQTWQYDTNSIQDDYARSACMQAVPVVCPEDEVIPPVPGEVCKTTDCTVALTNPNCLCDAIKCADVVAGMDALVRYGHLVKVTPIVDGVLLPALMQVYDNVGATIDKLTTFNFDFAATGATVGPSAACDMTLCFQIEVCAFAGEGPVSMSDSIVNLREDWGINAKLIPVC